MKTFRRFVAILASALLMFFLASLPVLAQEGSEPDPAESSTGLIFRWLNFIIVFGGIAYLLAKHSGAFFQSNAKEIAARINEATAAKAEATRELSELNAKISHVDQEVAAIREAARRDWAAEIERLRASQAAEIEKINVTARAELVASERAAHQVLREAAASMAVDRAGALVNSKMNTEVRGKLFHSFLGELGRSKN